MTDQMTTCQPPECDLTQKQVAALRCIQIIIHQDHAWSSLDGETCTTCADRQRLVDFIQDEFGVQI